MKKLTKISGLILLTCLLTIASDSFGKLQVYLPLDGDLLDAAGGDNNGILINGTNGENQFVNGKLGQALDLQNGDYTTTGDGVSIPYKMTDSGTVAMWFMPRRIYNYNSIFDNSAQQDDWECWIYSDGRLRGRVESDNAVTADLNAISPDGDPRNKWFHIVFAWNRTGIDTVETMLYVNGISRDSSSGTWINPGDNFYLGGGNNGNDFGDGTWDDLRIYDHVLSEAEIRTLSMKGLVVEPQELRLTEGQSTYYSVVLDYPQGYEPHDEVFVTITPDSDLSVNSLSAGEPETLVFESGTFTKPQSIQVTAFNDLVHTGNRKATVTHEISSLDEYWDNMEDIRLDVFIIENDLSCGDWGYKEMDFNRDCYVNLGDFVSFAGQWMGCTDPSGASCDYLSDVIIVAHRGYSAAAPENTIASCNAARGYANMVEFDVRTTSDNQLVLMHDATVDRTTNGTGTVEAMTFAELRQLDAGSWFSPDFSGELVPLMSEAALANLPDMVPFIERKSGAAQMYADMIQSLRIEKEAIVISFDWNFLAELEVLSPVIRTGALGSGVLDVSDIQSIQSKGIDFIDWAHSEITGASINLVHSYGMELHVWTVNDPARMQTLIDLGIDGITTDNPELARQLLDK